MRSFPETLAFVGLRLLVAAAMAAVIGAPLPTPASADHGTHVTLEPDTRGCNGVLPSTDGNTDLRFAGGSMQPGSTALFEITYPVNAASVGKQFTISDCAFINDVAVLRYTISFVPSNQSYVLLMALAVPADAPVGGQYCTYAKTTGSPSVAGQPAEGRAVLLHDPGTQPGRGCAGSTRQPAGDGWCTSSPAERHAGQLRRTGTGRAAVPAGHRHRGSDGRSIAT